MVKHSENLTEFIGHINEFGKLGNKSNLDIIHEKTVFEIWENENGFIELESALNSNDSIIKNFGTTLPENFVIADLRNAKNKDGFAWGKFGPNIERTKRHENELMWGIEKPIKKGFMAKLFGR